jgi:hypothetical protein
MVGFLVGGIFYNQAYRHWFYTLILLALIIFEATRQQMMNTAEQPGVAAESKPGTDFR